MHAIHDVVVNSKSTVSSLLADGDYKHCDVRPGYPIRASTCTSHNCVDTLPHPPHQPTKPRHVTVIAFVYLSISEAYSRQDMQEVGSRMLRTTLFCCLTIQVRIAKCAPFCVARNVPAYQNSGSDHNNGEKRLASVLSVVFGRTWV